jgi:hypothetical protein
MLSIIGDVVIIGLLGIIGYVVLRHQREIAAIKEDIGELELGIGCLSEDMKGLKKKQKDAGGKKTSQP